MKLWLAAIFIFCSVRVFAGDTIQVSLASHSIGARDSIEFRCQIVDYGKRGLAAATMNVWIQHIETRQVWKFRYPVLNGVLDAALAIGDSIPPGKYAVNFILQRGLFRVQGMVKNNFSHSSLNYMAVLKGNKRMVNTVPLEPSGAFLLKNIVFEDQGFFVFTPDKKDKKAKKNDLYIDVVAPLDSAFTPLAIHTELIDVKPELMQTPASATGYQFDFTRTYINTTLPEVVVTSTGKKRVDLYDEKYSTGLFRNDDARVFDGLDESDITTYQDIPSFLITKIPGLLVTNDGNMFWRNEPVVVYIDEFRMEPNDPIYVTPSEVAMIKVFSPPAAVNSGFSFGGAVAIYTKRGSFENNSTRRFKFVFRGYTPFDSAWK